MQDYFKDKVCLVTGAASGIGYSLAKALLAGGAKVTLADINTEGLEKAKEQLDAGNRARFTAVDVSNFESVKAAAAVAEEFGDIDILFNNAGICRGMLYEETTLKDWDNIIGINLMGVVNGIYAVMDKMIAKKQGQIVNTASISGLVPTPLESMYTATKFAVVGLTEALRFEFKRYNIDFSVICPSDIRTPLFANSIFIHGQAVKDISGYASSAGKAMTGPDEAAEKILSGVADKQSTILVGMTAERFLNGYRSENSDAYMTDWTNNRLKMISSMTQSRK